MVACDCKLRRVLEVLDIETFLVFFFFFLSSFLQKTMTRKENAKLHRVLVVAGAHLPDDLVFVSRDPGKMEEGWESQGNANFSS